MKTSRELFYWFEFKDIQILLYIAAFRTKVKAEKGELQFQNIWTRHAAGDIFRFENHF